MFPSFQFGCSLLEMRRFLPAGGFQPHFRDPEQTVQQRLVHDHVVDAGERDLAPRTVQQALSHRQAVAADDIAVGEVLQDGQDHQRRHADDGGHRDPEVTVVALARAEHEQRDEREDELLELLQQHEQPRPRMQSAFGQGSIHGEFVHHSASS